MRKCSIEIRHFLKKLASEVKEETEWELESGVGGGRTENVCIGWDGHKQKGGGVQETEVTAE